MELGFDLIGFSMFSNTIFFIADKKNKERKIEAPLSEGHLDDPGKPSGYHGGRVLLAWEWAHLGLHGTIRGDTLGWRTTWPS